MRVLSTFLAAVLFACAALPAASAPILFSATLSGAAETPPNPSAATGSVDVTVDVVTGAISVSVSADGLLAPTTAGHLHVAPPGVAGPIVLPFAGMPLGVTSFTYTHSFTASDLVNPGLTGIGNAVQLLAALEAGLIYANVHSALFPAGEIRGQLHPATAIPEPASAALFVVALGAALLLGQARRARP
jgi:hypothetical protein